MIEPVNTSKHEGASTFSKGLRVLACFESGQKSFSMAELSRLSGFDRAATRRLCLSLVEAGYLNKSGQQLSLSPKVLSLAGAYLAVNDIGLSVQPVLDRFAAELGYQISLAVHDGDRAIYLAESRAGSSRLSFGFTVGSSLPLLHTAIGRMIMAGCESEHVEAVFERITPHRYTEDTEMDLAVIRNALRAVASQDYCFLQNEFEPGAAAMAVPVGKMAGQAAVVGTTNTLNAFKDGGEQERALHILRQTAMTLRRMSMFS